MKELLSVTDRRDAYTLHLFFQAFKMFDAPYFTFSRLIASSQIPEPYNRMPKIRTNRTKPPPEGYEDIA